MKLKDRHRGANGTGGTPLVRTFSKAVLLSSIPLLDALITDLPGGDPGFDFPRSVALGSLWTLCRALPSVSTSPCSVRAGACCTVRSARNGMRAPRATCTIIRIYMITRAARPSVRSASL